MVTDTTWTITILQISRNLADLSADLGPTYMYQLCEPTHNKNDSLPIIFGVTRTPQKAFISASTDVVSNFSREKCFKTCCDQLGLSN